MYIQGNLQWVFDALYEMGVIDPVLKMDWSRALDEYEHHFDTVSQAIQVVNSQWEGPEELVEKLQTFDPEVLNYLAMEVAREFAEFHSRDSVQ